MVPSRFDTLTRALDAIPRRALLHFAAMGLGLSALHVPPMVLAKQKPIPNAYGCLNVGQSCRGKDARCCSGICRGKKPRKGKPRKGKKDKRKCAPHNTGGCTAAQDSCAVEQNVPCLSNGVCTRTTGEANFCARLGVGTCTECKRDADCYLMGPGAACIVCPYSCPQTTTACFAAAA
jgi:hypothetical protein